MAKPTLIQVFGAGATQSATTLTISKADLAATGLTASAINTPESLLIAILLLSKSQLTAANQDLNPEQSTIIAEQDFNFQELVPRNNVVYRQSTYTARFQAIDTNTTTDPDNY